MRYLIALYHGRLFTRMLPPLDCECHHVLITTVIITFTVILTSFTANCVADIVLTAVCALLELLTIAWNLGGELPGDANHQKACSGNISATAGEPSLLGKV